MLLPLVLLFILVPIVEIYAIIQVGEAIGAWWTIALLIAGSALGSILIRSQGRAVWRRFNTALSQGRPPARELVDGALVILGGALLLTPGFVTDAVGLLLLLPPGRAVVRRLLARRIGAVPLADRRPRRSDQAGYDVDATASEVRDPGQLP